jgi:hypothetical protein
MEKFDCFFESLNISESSLQSIKKTENNLIQTPVYTFVIPYLFYTYTFYIITRIPCIENTQISRKTGLNYQYLMGKFFGNFEVHMSAEDDTFFAEASPMADRRKLPLYHMCTILSFYQHLPQRFHEILRMRTAGHSTMLTPPLHGVFGHT